MLFFIVSVYRERLELSVWGSVVDVEVDRFLTLLEEIKRNKVGSEVLATPVYLYISGVERRIWLGF